MDKKRLNHEIVPEIRQGDIDAWNRGKGDNLRNKLLRASQKLSPDRAVKFVKMFADLGDIHFLATRFDISPDEGRRILEAFKINSIEDAKKAVNSGLIADLDRAVEQERNEAEQQNKVDHAEATERHEAHQKASQKEALTGDEADIALQARRDKAQQQNKADAIRQMIAEGIDPLTNTSDFRIRMNEIAEFKRMIPLGVGQLQRRFGGTPKDVVNEIKRLAPQYDADMLRP